MRRPFRGLAIGCLLGLACWFGLGKLVLAAAQPVLGFNWVANFAAPPGETPQSALARIRGGAYRDYTDPFSGDTDRVRIRLVRYGDTYRPSNALPGATYQLGNEPNLAEQDNAVHTQGQASTFAVWYHDMVLAIRAANPTARIIGPGVWGWSGNGSSCCTLGSDAYQWFVTAHQSLYGTPPDMQYIAVHVYPWYQQAWDDPPLGVGTGLLQVDGAQQWSAGRWPVVVTEWGLLRRLFACGVHTMQTDDERRTYTRGMLDGMAARAVPMALYYASHEQQCNSNGWMSWLINQNGSLTPEGQAHVGIVQVPLPTPGGAQYGPGVRHRSTATPVP